MYGSYMIYSYFFIGRTVRPYELLDSKTLTVVLPVENAPPLFDLPMFNILTW